MMEVSSLLPCRSLLSNMSEEEDDATKAFSVPNT